jgi:hypothetical protein
MSTLPFQHMIFLHLHPSYIIPVQSSSPYSSNTLSRVTLGGCGTEDSFLADEPLDNVHKTLFVPQSLPESAFLVLHQVELSRYSQVSVPLGGQRFELDLCPFLLQQSTGRGDTGNAGTFIRTVSPALNCIGQVTLIICVPIKTSKTCPGMACGGKVRWTTALKQKGGRLWLLCEFDWLYSLDSHYCSLVSLL